MNVLPLVLTVTSDDTIFAHGQLRVTLLFCGSSAGIQIECNVEEKVIKNIVFEEAL